LATAAIAIMFFVMLAAPCAVAVRSSWHWDTTDPLPEDEWELEAAPVVLAVMAPVQLRAQSLETLVQEAELEAWTLQDVAREARRAALTAAARAARIRADVAIALAAEAGRAADAAMIAARSQRADGADRTVLSPGERELKSLLQRLRSRAA
jgi:hypothetical protein